MGNIDAKYKTDDARARILYRDALSGLNRKHFNNTLRACMAADVAKYGLDAGSPVVLDEEGTRSILTERPAAYRVQVLDVRSDLVRSVQTELLRVLWFTRPAIDAGELPAELPELTARWRGAATAGGGPGAGLSDGPADGISSGPGAEAEPGHGIVLELDATRCPRQFDPVKLAAALPAVARVGRAYGSGTQWLDPRRGLSDVGRVRALHVHVPLPAEDRLSAAESAVADLVAQDLPLRRIVSDLGVGEGSRRAPALTAEERQLLEAVYVQPRAFRPAGASATPITVSTPPARNRANGTAALRPR